MTNPQRTLTNDEPTTPEFVKIKDMKWVPVRVYARCEKIVKRFCEVNRIKYYLPIKEHISRYQRRIVKTQIPMFPGYIFVQVSTTDKMFLKGFQKVVNIFRINSGEEETLIAELNSIRLLEKMQWEKEIQIKPELVQGKSVVITSGPFQGMLGIVKKRKKTLRVSVNIEMLGQSVTAELDIGDITVEK